MLALTATEQRLMRMLMLADGQWVDQAQLLRAGWPDWYSGGVVEPDMAHVIRVNVSRIRAKISGTSSTIENDRRGQYRLVAAHMAVA